MVVLRERWDKLAKEHPERFQVVYSLDKPPYFWRGEKGYITKEMIQKYLPKDNAKDVKVGRVVFPQEPSADRLISPLVLRVWTVRFVVAVLSVHG